MSTLFSQKVARIASSRCGSKEKNFSIAIRIGQNSTNTMCGNLYSKGGRRMPPTPLPGIPTISLGDCLASIPYQPSRNSICSPCCTYVAPNQTTAAATPTAAVMPPRWGGGLGSSCTAPTATTPTPRDLMYACAPPIRYAREQPPWVPFGARGLRQETFRPRYAGTPSAFSIPPPVPFRPTGDHLCGGW